MNDLVNCLGKMVTSYNEKLQEVIKCVAELTELINLAAEDTTCVNEPTEPDYHTLRAWYDTIVLSITSGVLLEVYPEWNEILKKPYGFRSLGKLILCVGDSFDLNVPAPEVQ